MRVDESIRQEEITSAPGYERPPSQRAPCDPPWDDELATLERSHLDVLPSILLLLEQASNVLPADIALDENYHAAFVHCEQGVDEILELAVR